MKNTNKDLAAVQPTLESVQLSQVIEQLEELLFCDLVMTYNDYASHNGYELIHDNDEENINTLFETPYDAAQAVVYGKYNPNDDYVTLDGYSNAISFSYQLTQDDNCPIDISELAEWLINEDKLSEYSITVTTIEDMLASIEDSISDDEHMLHSLMDYLNIGYDIDKVSLLGADYETSLIDECVYILEGSVIDKTQDIYEKLVNVIEYLGINYQ